MATTCRASRAGSLVDDTWMYGGTDDKVLESIREGRADAGMPSFKTTLSDVEIRGLLLLIRDDARRRRKVGPRHGATPVVDGVVKTPKQTFRIETLTDAVETPWGLAFLPDGRLLITERPGRLRILDNGKLSEPVEGIPAVWTRQDGGLFDVEVHPKYAQNGWIYLAYAEPRETNRSMTTIIRGGLKTTSGSIRSTSIARPTNCSRRSTFTTGCASRSIATATSITRSATMASPRARRIFRSPRARFIACMTTARFRRTIRS